MMNDELLTQHANTLNRKRLRVKLTVSIGQTTRTLRALEAIRQARAPEEERAAKWNGAH